MRDVHVTVAAIVARDDKFLLVEETVGSRTVLNQPAGHWEPGETLVEAVVREALEETGWDLEPTALLGVYAHRPDDLAYDFLRFAFIATALRHQSGRLLDPGIVCAVWLTRDELRRESARHRSPMVLRCVEDFLSDQQHPLSVVSHLA